jgi:flagellar basal body-associated protein FliL
MSIHRDQKTHDLTMLYLSQKDVSEMPPQGIAELYDEISKKISKTLSDLTPKTSFNSSPATKGGF